MTLRSRVRGRCARRVRRVRNAGVRRIDSAAVAAVARDSPRVAAYARIAVSYGVESMPDDLRRRLRRCRQVSLLDREISERPARLQRPLPRVELDADRCTEARPTRAKTTRSRSCGTRTASRTAAGTATAGSWSTGPRARLLHEADHVVYQSAFCKLSADRFYGERTVAVRGAATTRSTRPPSPAPSTRSASAHAAARRQPVPALPRRAALEALADVSSERPDARLLVAGALSFAPDGAGETRAFVRRARPRRCGRAHRPVHAERRARRSCAGDVAPAIRSTTTRARRSCSRRWRAGCRSSTRRAAARRSSSATTPASAYPGRPRLGARPSARRRAARRGGPRSSPTTCRRARGRARARDRFDARRWVDRHSRALRRADGAAGRAILAR